MDWINLTGVGMVIFGLVLLIWFIISLLMPWQYLPSYETDVKTIHNIQYIIAEKDGYITICNLNATFKKTFNNVDRIYIYWPDKSVLYAGISLKEFGPDEPKISEKSLDN